MGVNNFFGKRTKNQQKVMGEVGQAISQTQSDQDGAIGAGLKSGLSTALMTGDPMTAGLAAITAGFGASQKAKAAQKQARNRVLQQAAAAKNTAIQGAEQNRARQISDALARLQTGFRGLGQSQGIRL